jgi:hypothetical protein
MTRRQTLFLALVVFVLLLAVRTTISGWGPPTHPPTTPSTTFGIAAYPADNLSYSAWAQQAKGGLWRFGILYTTTEHERLMFNSLFLLVGRLAGLLAVSPLLVLNVMAAASLPIFMFCLSSMCRTLGLGAGATLGVMCLAIGGGGISWIRKAVEWSGLHRVLPVGGPGPDVSYYDVYPGVAYFIAPYHSIAYAVVAALALVIVRLDDERNRVTVTKLTLLIVAALVLATARPHISIVMLAAYCSVTAATFCVRLPRALLVRRIIIAACLGGAMVPPILYAIWVSRQPAWRSFSEAHRSAAHDWMVGFFLLWVLAAVGVGVLGSRVLATPFAFLVGWAAAAAALLLVLNGYLNPKLTAGSTIALAALAGAAIHEYTGRLRSRGSMRVTIAVIAFMALASSAITIVRLIQHPTATASELFEVIQAIRRDTAAPFPTVLADCGTGVLLPGLAGHRVFCGHWALTENNRHRIVLLSRLGFLAEGQAMPSIPGVDDAEVASDAAVLRRQIAGDTFQYLVVQKAFRLYQEFESIGPGCTVHDGKRYLVVRMCPDVKAELERRLRA